VLRLLLLVLPMLLLGEAEPLKDGAREDDLRDEPLGELTGAAWQYAVSIDCLREPVVAAVNAMVW
jgi:hypothetical protein